MDLRHGRDHDEAAAQLSRDLVAELARLRREAGLSQTELAALIGTHQSTVSDAERLAHDPKLTTVILWARAVGVVVVIRPNKRNA